jgi:hypothetical protein
VGLWPWLDSELIGDNMSLDKFVTMYLDWVNNFISVQRFADHYQISVDTAWKIIEIGHSIGELK